MDLQDWLRLKHTLPVTDLRPSSQANNDPWLFVRCHVTVTDGLIMNKRRGTITDGILKNVLFQDEHWDDDANDRCAK